MLKQVLNHQTKRVQKRSMFNATLTINTHAFSIKKAANKVPCSWPFPTNKSNSAWDESNTFQTEKCCKQNLQSQNTYLWITEGRPSFAISKKKTGSQWVSVFIVNVTHPNNNTMSLWMQHTMSSRLYQKFLHCSAFGGGKQKFAHVTVIEIDFIGSNLGIFNKLGLFKVPTMNTWKKGPKKWVLIANKSPSPAIFWLWCTCVQHSVFWSSQKMHFLIQNCQQLKQNYIHNIHSRVWTN